MTYCLKRSSATGDCDVRTSKRVEAVTQSVLRIAEQGPGAFLETGSTSNKEDLEVASVLENCTITYSKCYCSAKNFQGFRALQNSTVAFRKQIRLPARCQALDKIASRVEAGHLISLRTYGLNNLGRLVLLEGTGRTTAQKVLSESFFCYSASLPGSK